MKRFVLTLALSLIFSPTTGLSATVGDERGFLELKGEIVQGDYDKIVTLLKKKEDFGLLILLLDSPGGDVYEGMKIGRLVRSALIQTGAQRCWSACALIALAEGTDNVRMMAKAFKTDLAFHRAYLSPEVNKDLSLTNSLMLDKQVSKDLKSYLVEMEVETWVIEKILDHSSQEAWTLTYSEIQQVFKEWSGFEEWITAKCGSMTESERNDHLLTTTVHSWSQYDPPFAPSGGNNYMSRMAIESGGNNWKEKYNSFTPGYKNYLKEKSEAITNCRWVEIENHRKEVITSLP